MTLQPFAVQPQIGQLIAATPPLPAGFPLVNGTPTILTWTAPNDGKQHRVQLWGDVNVSVATTGGLINIHLTDPGGTAGTLQMDAGSHAGTGFFVSSSRNLLLAPGSVLTISQDSALTLGAAIFYGEIWGS